MFSACIIEDDASTAQSLRATLCRLGCDVLVSEGSRESLGDIRERPCIDVAFVALSLRNASARGVAREIRSRHPWSKVFFVTSWEGEFDRDVLDAEGVAGIIKKPPRFSEVKRTLIEHLG
ncbi:MAG: response regulator [Chitinivibrionales bacterium]|nr:response regulator [Chitinivibrionales bacterium]MBD3395640.1 response regulator [Chitinivibrionales bacterium]